MHQVQAHFGSNQEDAGDCGVVLPLFMHMHTFPALTLIIRFTVLI